jgi:hypothetical protein
MLHTGVRQGLGDLPHGRQRAGIVLHRAAEIGVHLGLEIVRNGDARDFELLQHRLQDLVPLSDSDDLAREIGIHAGGAVQLARKFGANELRHDISCGNSGHPSNLDADTSCPLECGYSGPVHFRSLYHRCQFQCGNGDLAVPVQDSRSARLA